MKVVYKYGTGHYIPDGAKYLYTHVQLREFVPAHKVTDIGRGSPTQGQEFEMPAMWEDCYWVWHYYEVEIRDA